MSEVPAELPWPAQGNSAACFDSHCWRKLKPGRHLQVHKAKARLREIHATKLRQRVEQMMAGEDVPKAMGWAAEDEQVPFKCSMP